VCQPSSLPELGGRALTRVTNCTPRSNFFYCCTTGGRPHPSHPAFPFARRAGDLPESPETPLHFFFHDRAGDLHETPRVTPNDGCLPYSCPHPITETYAYRVCLPKSRRIYARASFATCSTTSHFFLDHRILMFECPSSNECQMLQRLAIFIRAVERVAAQADSTTACQNALTRRKLAIQLLVRKQSFFQVAPTCESACVLCQTLPRYKPTIAPPLM
jgi:hypothetical protein